MEFPFTMQNCNTELMGRLAGAAAGLGLPWFNACKHRGATMFGNQDSASVAKSRRFILVPGF